MAISVADNFSYKGSKPLDARIQYSTVANMKNATTSDLYDGCLAYVTETKKNYQYDSSNTVDEILGKWRELQTGGGGGSSTFADLDDVDLNNLQNGQIPKWNSQTEKWENANESGGGGASAFSDLTDVSISNVQNGQVPKWNSQTSKWENANFDTFDMSSLSVDSLNFSLSEKVIGTWIDGKPLYQKTITFSYLQPANNNTSATVILAKSEVDTMTLISADVNIVSTIVNSNNVAYPGNLFTYSIKRSTKDGLVFLATTNNYSEWTPATRDDGKVTIQYTKTSDSALANGEKIVGQWIDGKPLYQKTIDFEGLPSNAQKQVSIANLSIDRVVYCGGYALNPTSHNMRPIVLASGSVNDQIRVGINQNNTIDLNTYTTWTGYSECYITLQYTKTTD